MKKGIFSLILILAAAGAVFYFGWAQNKVGIGEAGVLISKTGGVSKKIIKNGDFFWNWQLLIPKNAKVVTFPLQTQTFKKSISTKLPSGDLYSLQLKETPDFSYSFDFSISLSLSEDNLATLVEKNNLQSAEDCKNYLDSKADEIARAAASYISSLQAEKLADSVSLSSESVLRGIKAETAFPDVKISSLTVLKSNFADHDLYELAKKSYLDFQSLVNQEMASAAKSQAQAILKDDRTVKKLQRIGETLKNYPQLSEILKNGDTVQVIKALSELN